MKIEKRDKSFLYKKFNIIYLLIFIILVSPIIFYTNNKYYFNAFYTKYFQIKNISIEGCKNISQKDVKLKINHLYDKNIILVNPWIIRKELTKFMMISDVQVMKKFPNTLNINIIERKPLLILSESNKYYILDNDMKLINIEKNLIDHYSILKNLTYVEGENITQNASDIINLFSVDKIKNRISALYRINNRRWDMIIDKKIKLMLPENTTSEFVIHAFNLVDSFKANGSINLNAFYSIIDLRIKNKVFIKNITD